MVSAVSVVSLFRQMFGAEGYEVVAINDLTKPSMLAQLAQVRYSSGRLLWQDR